MTKRLGKGKGEEMMWSAVRVVSDAVESSMSDKDKDALMARLYGMLSGGHFDEEYAVEAVSKMCYKDKDGIKRSAPYWTIPEVEEIYDDVKDRIPKEYNMWDFYVTFQMVASDNWNLIHRWWPEIKQDEFAKRITDLAVNFLDDSDNPYGTRKIWCYLHPAK